MKKRLTNSEWALQAHSELGVMYESDSDAKYYIELVVFIESTVFYDDFIKESWLLCLKVTLTFI